MKELVFIKPGLLEWHEQAEPEIQAPSDMLVRPIVVARCDLDARYLFENVYAQLKFGLAKKVVDIAVSHYMGSSPFKGPFPFGHECVAEVVKCGSDVSGFHPGDQVIVPFQVSCGACSRCSHHFTASCETVPPMSLFGFGSAGGDWGGAMSDVLRVPYADHLAVPVPSSLNPVEIASGSDNLPVAWQAVAPLLTTRPNAPVLVVGGGAPSIGLYSVGFARALGASQVVYMDMNNDGEARARFEIAEALGASCTEESPTGTPEQLYPCTVDASSSQEGLLYCLRALESDGVCSSPSMYFEAAAPMPLFQLYAKRSTLRMGYGNARGDIAQMLRVLVEGSFQPGLVTSLVADWDDAARAFLEPGAKVVVHRPPHGKEPTL